MKGVVCNVYRPARDRPYVTNCLSHRVNFVTLCGPEIPEHSEPTEKAPAVVLKERQIDGAPYFHAEPAGGIAYGYRAGDSFAFTLGLDRLRYPIRIHDVLDELRDFTE